MQAPRIDTKRRIISGGLLWLFFISRLFAADVIVSWDPNTEPDLKGYKVYYGTASRNYSHVIDVGLVTNHTLQNLAENTHYYFAVTAYDVNGNESNFSQEVSLYIPPSDTIPPAISGIEIIDETHLIVRYSEPVDEPTATNRANYAINPNVNILAAELLPDLSSVKLTTALHNPGIYTLSVINVKDRAAQPNTIAPGASFSYQIQDQAPPQLIGAHAVSETQVDVVFSEPVTQQSAENISNYQISPSIQILAAQLEADLRTVHLTSSKHVENTYTLTVNHIFDRAATPNQIAANSQATYQYVDQIKPQLVRLDVISDVKLNVVFSEPVEKASAENVANYQIQTGVTIQSAVLKTNLKEVELTTSPHGEGNYRLIVQHVRDRANIPNEIQANSFLDYEYVDTIPPELLQVHVSSDSEIVAIFSESLEKNSAENVSNYSINSGVSVLSAQLDGASLKKVFLKTTPHAEQSYTLTVTGVRDQANNPNVISNQNQITYEFVDQFPPRLVNVVVLSDDLLDVHFSEPIQKSTAENIANYSIVPEVQILSASLDANKKVVHLTTEKHSEGSYVISATGIRDIANSPNTIANDNSFSYNYVDQIKPEIVNVTCEFDSLVQIQFSEAVETSSALNVGNYVISPFVQIKNVSLSSNLKTVTLKTEPHAEGTYQLTVNNVRDRAQVPNEILANSSFNYQYVDTFAPELIALNVVGDTLLEIRFNEPVTKSSAENVSNYSITPGIVLQNANLQNDNKTVILETSKHQEGNYSLFVVGISDRAANSNTITQTIVKNYQYVDFIAPQILSVVAPKENQVDVFFSETMDKTTAENKENYQISDGIVVNSAVLDVNQTVVHLSTTKHVPGAYTITVFNVRDNSSQKNSIANNTQVSYQYIDLMPPEVIAVGAPLENQVDVTFSEPVEKISAEDAANYQIDNGIQIYSAVLDANLTVVHLQTSTHVPGNYNLTVQNIRDRAVNPNQMANIVNFAYAYVDRTPPQITNVRALSDTTVEIIFSEVVDPVSSQIKSNYTINNNIQVFSATLQSDEKTVLLGTSPHTSGQYVLEINNVKDQAENPNMIPSGTRFSYQYQDQIPPELVNVVSLDETHVDVYFSEPVERVSAEDITHYSINNNIQVLAAQLSANGEIVHLQTSAHVPGWYRLTVAQILDRATPANVIAANSYADYQYIDRTPPVALQVETTDETHVKITFSEPLDKNSAENITNYSINGNISVLSATLDVTETVVTLQTTVHQPGQYTITLSNIKDKAQNPNTIPAGFQISYEYVDRIPPVIVNVDCPAETLVNVVFSEPITRESAENISNYQISPSIQILAAQLEADLRTVHLTSSKHVENTYTLTVNHIFDRAATPNQIAANSQATYQYVDQIKPQLVRLDVISDVKLNVVFSEPVEKASAENVANYQIQTGVTIQSAVLKTNLKEVELTTSPHGEGNYRLIVQHVRDRANIPNEIQANSFLDYEYVDTIPPELLQVQVSSDSEIVAIFSESLEKSSAENVSNYSISSGVSVLSAQLDGASLKKVFLKTTPHAEQSYTLTVTSVRDRANNPNVIANRNQVNYEFVDVFPPQVLSVEAISDTVVEIKFSEPMKKTTAENVSNYQITPTVSVRQAMLNSDGKKVTLLTGAHAEGTFQIVLQNLTDRANSPNSLTQNTFSYDYQDVFPPIAENVQMISDSKLEIIFNEPVETSSAENIANYTIDQNIQILSAKLSPDGTKVELQTSPHGEGVYHLTLSGIKDRAQQPNTIATGTILQYQYIDTIAPSVVEVAAVSEDTVRIIFSESMNKQKAEDVSNYSITNGIQVFSAKLKSDAKTVLLGTTVHGEGSYVLELNNLCDRAQSPNYIAPHTQISYQFIDTIAPVIISVQSTGPNSVEINFNEPVNVSDAEKSSNYSINRGINVTAAAVTNGGKRVELTTSVHGEGEYVLQVQGIHDRAQQPNLMTKQTVSYNYLDNIPPEALSVEILADTHLVVTFSEPIEKSSAENPANYQIVPHVPIYSATLSADTITVHLITASHAEGNYALQISNITDRSSLSNPISGQTSLSYEYVDRVKPEITGVEAISPTTVVVAFSEKISVETAEDTSNYAINNNIQVLSARLDSSESNVILETTVHQVGNYIIIIDNIQDRAAQPNTITPHSYYTYTYTDRIPPDVNQVEVVSPSHLKIIFNEPVSRNSAENANNFKIYAASEDIDVLKIGEDSRNIIQNEMSSGAGNADVIVEIQDLTLDIDERVLHVLTAEQNPGEYVVAVKNIQDQAAIPNVLEQEKVIHYQVEDLIPPTISSVQATQENEIRIVFSEPVLPASATDTTNYEINQGIKVLSASIDLSMTEVTLKTNAHRNGEKYVLKVNGIVDISENHNEIEKDTQIEYVFVKQNPDKPEPIQFTSLEANGDGGLVAVWQASQDAEIVNYKIYYGKQSRQYTTVLSVGNRTSFTIANLNEGVTYYAAITAVNNYGQESDFSNELSQIVTMRDVTPPQVANIDARCDTVLVLQFTEPIKRSTAEEISNFQINRGIQVLSAALDQDEKTLKLTTTPHLSGEYRLRISGVEDLAPNPNLVPENYLVQYYFHPNDKIAPEVVELNLISKNKIEIVFSELVEKNDAENIDNYSISPALSIFSANFYASENTVYLTTESHHDGTWYTINIRDIRDVASPPNTIAPNTTIQYQFRESDNLPPEIFSVQAISATELLVQFNEGVSSTSARNTENYQISSGIEVINATLLLDQRTVSLKTTPHQPNLIYKISVNNIHDLATPPNFSETGFEYDYVYNPDDFDPPELLNVEPVNATTLKLTFSEFLQRKSAELESNYQINNDITVVKAILDANPNTVFLTTSTHISGTHYQITVNRIKDTAPVANVIRANTTKEYYYFETDQTPPAAEFCELVSANLLKIGFSERVSRETAENISNYIIIPAVPIFTATLDSSLQCVTLETAAHEPGKTYQILITGIEDRAAPPNRLSRPVRLTYYLKSEHNKIADNLIPVKYQFKYQSVGDSCYLDTETVIRSIPESLTGSLWIRTAQSDSNNAKNAFLAFRLKKRASVFIGVDPNARNYPNWLVDKFHRTGDRIEVDADFAYFDLWAAEMDTGFVILGGNMATGAEKVKNMFVVLIKPVADMELNIPDGMGDPLSQTEVQDFQLIQNYPNPFNAETKIQFALPNQAHVKIELFNILGQQIITLVDDVRDAGKYLLLWHGKDKNGLVVATGVYFMRMTAWEEDQKLGANRKVFQKVRKVLFIR